MKLHALVSIILFCSATVLAIPVGPALSPSGIPGVMTYESTVAVPKGMAMTQENLYRLVNLQTKHLMSILERPEFSRINGVNRPNADLGFMGLGALEAVQVVGRTPDGLLKYRAKNKVIVLRRVLQPGQTKQLKLVLPIDPVNIYARACTDKQYYEKQYFFYYWNPYDPECQKHLTGPNAVETITAHVVGYEAPPATARPDYQTLSQQVKIRGELHISLLLGFDLGSVDPKDLGRQSYNYFLGVFAKDGFVVDRHRNTPTGPFVELVREARGLSPKIHLSMSLSMSDQNNPIVFSRRAREAFETSDIVMYAGHSGLGGNLDLEKLTRLSSPDPAHPTPIRFPNAYQIYFLDSCGSYYFYSQEYLLATKGAHHVDVVTNGTAADFDSQNRETLNFLHYFIDPQGPATWLQILASEESAAHGLTYLVNVTPVR